MESKQQLQEPDDAHIGLPIEEEVRAIVVRQKGQGNTIGSMHREMAKSADLARSLSRLFNRYGVGVEGNSDDAAIAFPPSYPGARG